MGPYEAADAAEARRAELDAGLTDEELAFRDLDRDLHGSWGDDVPATLRAGTPYGDMVLRAQAFFRGERTPIPEELADFLLCRGNPAAWEALQGMPRYVRQAWFDFTIAGGLWRGQ